MSSAITWANVATRSVMTSPDSSCASIAALKNRRAAAMLRRFEAGTSVTTQLSYTPKSAALRTNTAMAPHYRPFLQPYSVQCHSQILRGNALTLDRRSTHARVKRMFTPAPSTVRPRIGSLTTSGTGVVRARDARRAWQRGH